MKIPAIEPLTDGEERIMQMLWSLGEGTVNDILAVIPEPKPKYTTVATFIKILENKGYVAHRSEGKYEGENETYIEASVENSGSILYDKEIRNKPRTRRTKRNV